MYNSLFYYLLKTNTQHSQSCDERVRAEWFTRHGGGDFESQVLSSLAGDLWGCFSLPPLQTGETCLSLEKYCDRFTQNIKKLHNYKW